MTSTFLHIHQSRLYDEASKKKVNWACNTSKGKVVCEEACRRASLTLVAISVQACIFLRHIGHCSRSAVLLVMRCLLTDVQVDMSLGILEVSVDCEHVITPVSIRREINKHGGTIRLGASGAIVTVTKVHASRLRKDFNPPPPYRLALSKQYRVASFATARVLSCLHSRGLRCSCCRVTWFNCDSEACNLVTAAMTAKD
jgi:hypothetical protein